MLNTLIKYNKNHSLFDQLSEKIFNDVWSDPMFSLTRNFRPESYKETDKEHIVEIEVPRVKRSEIKCEAIQDNSIQISINNPNLKYTRIYSFTESDADKASIKLESGVLTISVPKIDTVKSKAKILDIKEIN